MRKQAGAIVGAVFLCCALAACNPFDSNSASQKPSLLQRTHAVYPTFAYQVREPASLGGRTEPAPYVQTRGLLYVSKDVGLSRTGPMSDAILVFPTTVVAGPCIASAWLVLNVSETTLDLDEMHVYASRYIDLASGRQRRGQLGYTTLIDTEPQGGARVLQRTWLRIDVTDLYQRLANGDAFRNGSSVDAGSPAVLEIRRGSETEATWSQTIAGLDSTPATRPRLDVTEKADC